MIVQVLTVEGQPEFEFSHAHEAYLIDQAVKHKFGRQPGGLPHNWRVSYKHPEVARELLHGSLADLDGSEI